MLWRSPARLLGAVVSLWLVCAAAFPAPALAYPFMIRHGYTGCGECHVDPSGSGVLTDYGRGQGVILLATPRGERGPDWEGPGKGKDFLFGAVNLPDPLMLQADFRWLLIPNPADPRVIGMQNDLRGALDFGSVVAYASAGFVTEGAEKARITSNLDGPNLVSREHWVGVRPTDELLVRAGSMNVPFGIRSDEHIQFARWVTRSDINDGQSYGLDANLAVGKVRAEAMAVVGDFQVRPSDVALEAGERFDAYHERGYVANVGWAPENNVEIGVSSLTTYAQLDVDLRDSQGDPDGPRLRNANEIYARWSPSQPLVLMSEAGLLYDQVDGDARSGGFAYLQADVEPVQGLHFKGTGEVCHDGTPGELPPVGRGWFAAQWFVAPRVDVRADAMYGTLYCTPGVEPRFMALVQAHVYL